MLLFKKAKYLDIGQSGSLLDLDSRCCWFKSSYPDHCGVDKLVKSLAFEVRVCRFESYLRSFKDTYSKTITTYCSINTYCYGKTVVRVRIPPETDYLCGVTVALIYCVLFGRISHPLPFYKKYRHPQQFNFQNFI